MKTCKKCKRDLPPESFHKMAAAGDGLHTQCKSCRSAATKAYRKRIYAGEANISHEEYNAKKRAWVKTRPESWFIERSAKRYNTTVEHLTNLFNGNCQICSRPLQWGARDWFDRACVDHCHDSDKVRGILCNKCNCALGMFDDNIDIMNTATQYLRDTM